MCESDPAQEKRKTIEYSMEYKVCNKCGKWHTQCDCIVIITVQSAENQVKAELEVKSSLSSSLGLTVARARTSL